MIQSKSYNLLTHTSFLLSYVLMKWLVPLVRDSFFHHHLVTIITHVYIPYHTYSSTIRTLITSYTYSFHHMCVLYHLLCVYNTYCLTWVSEVLQWLWWMQCNQSFKCWVCHGHTLQAVQVCVVQWWSKDTSTEEVCWRHIGDPGVWGVGRGSNTPRPHGKQQHITIRIIMLA